MILPTIQLFWVALITRLLLLLTPLTTLLVVTTLAAMIILISLKPGIRAATAMTQAVRAARTATRPVTVMKEV